MNSTQKQAPGVRLATFERQGGEIRWSLDSYDGHRFINGRLWTLGKDGELHPTQKGITIRARELGDVIAALEKAFETLCTTDRFTTGAT